MRKDVSYTAKVVDRDVGRAKRQGSPRAGARCRCCRLSRPSSSLFLFPLPPRATLSSLPTPGLFIPFSVASSLSSSTSSLFLSFCPFSASANDSRLFISRLCIARGRARVLSFSVYSLLPSCRRRRRSSRTRIPPFFFLSPRLLTPPFRDATRNLCYVTPSR